MCNDAFVSLHSFNICNILSSYLRQQMFGIFIWEMKSLMWCGFYWIIIYIKITRKQFGSSLFAWSWNDQKPNFITSNSRNNTFYVRITKWDKMVLYEAFLISKHSLACVSRRKCVLIAYFIYYKITLWMLSFPAYMMLYIHQYNSKSCTDDFCALKLVCWL